MLLHIASKEWYDACAQAVAMSYTSTRSKQEKSHFRHMCCRLFSLLMASALQECSQLSDDVFEVLDLKGFDEFSLKALQSFKHHPKQRKELALQWILRFMITSMQDKVLAAPPPVLSRLFAEISNANLQFERIVTIAKTPFPFPYAQMISALLLIHLVYTAMIVSVLVEDPVWVSALCFISVFTFWCINYIASEIEAPFGEDLNDLAVRDLMTEFNESLLLLLDKRAEHLPGVKTIRRTQAEALTPECLSTVHSLATVELAKTASTCSLINKEFGEDDDADDEDDDGNDKDGPEEGRNFSKDAAVEQEPQQQQQQQQDTQQQEEQAQSPAESRDAKVLAPGGSARHHYGHWNTNDSWVSAGGSREELDVSLQKNADEGRKLEPLTGKLEPLTLMNEQLVQELSNLSSIGARLLKWIDEDLLLKQSRSSATTQLIPGSECSAEQQSLNRVWQV